MKFKLSNGHNLHVCKPSPVYFGEHLISPSRVTYHYMLYRYCHSVKLISFKCIKLSGNVENFGLLCTCMTLL